MQKCVPNIFTSQTLAKTCSRIHTYIFFGICSSKERKGDVFLTTWFMQFNKLKKFALWRRYQSSIPHVGQAWFAPINVTLFVPQRHQWLTFLNLVVTERISIHLNGQSNPTIQYHGEEDVSISLHCVRSVSFPQKCVHLCHCSSVCMAWITFPFCCKLKTVQYTSGSISFYEFAGWGKTWNSFRYFNTLETWKLTCSKNIITHDASFSFPPSFPFLGALQNFARLHWNVFHIRQCLRVWPHCIAVDFELVQSLFPMCSSAGRSACQDPHKPSTVHGHKCLVAMHEPPPHRNAWSCQLWRNSTKRRWWGRLQIHSWLQTTAEVQKEGWFNGRNFSHCVPNGTAYFEQKGSPGGHLGHSLKGLVGRPLHFARHVTFCDTTPLCCQTKSFQTSWCWNVGSNWAISLKTYWFRHKLHAFA